MSANYIVARGDQHGKDVPSAHDVMIQSSSNPIQHSGSSSTHFDCCAHGQRALYILGGISLTITGGRSAVRVRGSTACSIDSSPSTLCEVRLEFDRSRAVTWLSVRCRPNGACDDTLLLCRSEDCSQVSSDGEAAASRARNLLLLVDEAFQH